MAAPLLPRHPHPTERFINYGALPSPSTQIIGIIALKTPLNINQLSIYDARRSFQSERYCGGGKSVMIGKLMKATLCG